MLCKYMYFTNTGIWVILISLPSWNYKSLTSPGMNQLTNLAPSFLPTSHQHFSLLSSPSPISFPILPCLPPPSLPLSSFASFPPASFPASSPSFPHSLHGHPPFIPLPLSLPLVHPPFLPYPPTHFPLPPAFPHFSHDALCFLVQSRGF